MNFPHMFAVVANISWNNQNNEECYREPSSFIQAFWNTWQWMLGEKKHILNEKNACTIIEEYDD